MSHTVNDHLSGHEWLHGCLIRLHAVQGTVNVVEASKAAGVQQMILVSSIGTDEPIANPANLFWGILFWKKRAEEHLQRSGVPYTIVRPGGLVTDESDIEKDGKKRRKGKKSSGKGAVVMGRAGTYGFPPKKSGAILRSTVRSWIAYVSLNILIWLFWFDNFDSLCQLLVP